MFNTTTCYTISVFIIMQTHEFFFSLLYYYGFCIMMYYYNACYNSFINQPKLQSCRGTLNADPPLHINLTIWVVASLSKSDDVLEKLGEWADNLTSEMTMGSYNIWYRDNNGNANKSPDHMNFSDWKLENR